MEKNEHFCGKCGARLRETMVPGGRAEGGTNFRRSDGEPLFALELRCPNAILPELTFHTHYVISSELYVLRDGTYEKAW